MKCLPQTFIYRLFRSHSLPFVIFADCMKATNLNFYCPLIFWEVKKKNIGFFVSFYCLIVPLAFSIWHWHFYSTCFNPKRGQIQSADRTETFACSHSWTFKYFSPGSPYTSFNKCYCDDYDCRTVFSSLKRET